MSEGERRAVTLERSHPLYSRMKYYNRLTPSAESSHHFRAPQHIVWGGVSPYALFDTSGKQASSFSTVFSIWNVMVGSGLLVMPWAFQNAGLVGGSLVLALVGLGCFYTACIIVEHSHGFDDFPDMVMRYFGSPAMGKAGYYFASWSSVVMLLAVLVVYLTMISDFLHAVVSSIILWSHGREALNNFLTGAVSEWFSLKTVPVYMGLVLFPFTNMRDIGPLVKFNSFGILSILYIIGFIVTRGVHDISQTKPSFSSFSDKWYYLAGLSMVSFFIHNAILPIVRNKKSPKHNRRDLGLAFFLVFLTYASCGIAGYLAFSHTDIPQNFLNAYGYDEVTPFIARLALFVQLSGVYPLLAYIVRLQVFTILLSPPSPSSLSSSSSKKKGKKKGKGKGKGGDEERLGPKTSINTAASERSALLGDVEIADGVGNSMSASSRAVVAAASEEQVVDPRDPAYTPMSYMALLNAYIAIQTILISIYFPYIGTVLRFCGAFCAAPFVFFLPIGVLAGYYKDSPPNASWLVKGFWVWHTPILLIATALAVLQII